MVRNPVRATQAAVSASARVSNSRRPGPGRDDVVTFDRERSDPEVSKVLEWLGAAHVESAPAAPFKCPSYSDLDGDDGGKNKEPVFMTPELVNRIHEPREADVKVPLRCPLDKILKPEAERGESDRKWAGYWHGSEEGRVAYFKANYYSWGWIRPGQVRRKTGIFFIPRKDNQYRRILACIDLNNDSTTPPRTQLPGAWVLKKIRFRHKRFLSAEVDVSNFYNRFEAPRELMYFLAHDAIMVESVLPLVDGVYTCPFSGETFREGDEACPAFPSVPMGWNWSVALATDYAIELLDDAGVPGTSLNVGKDSFLRSDSLYRGAYIDNLFVIGDTREEVQACKEMIKAELVRRGLPISEESDAEFERVLVGLCLGKESNIDVERAATLSSPEKYGQEFYSISRCSYVRFSRFQRVVGLGAWLFTIRRLYFSLFYEIYRLLRRKMRNNTKKQAMVRLSKAVRDEFRAAAVLLPALESSLDFKPAEYVYASDASLEGWAVVRKQIGGGHIIDRGLEHPTVETERFLRGESWRTMKIRQFRTRLQQILPGEITGTRQTFVMASRQEKGKDILVLSDNTNVYHSVKKGRSGAYRLNMLCRLGLLVEILYGVRIHMRWVPTHLMPADVFTREKSLREREERLALEAAVGERGQESDSDVEPPLPTNNDAP